MENFSYHVPVYVVKGVATSGHSADLVGGQVGLYDRQTWSVATKSGSGTEFFFAQGSLGGFDWYLDKIEQTSHKSPMFYGKDIENMYLSKPSRRSNEEWIVGYNGAPSSKSIKYTKDGEPVKIEFLFTGGPAYRFFGGPKQYVVSYSVPQDCTDPCETGCTGDALDPLKYVKEHIDLINNHTELKKFGVSAQLVSDTYVAGTTTKEKFTLTLCDNGDGVALLAVKAQYPTLDVKRISRLGTSSVYEVCVPSTGGDDTPAPFTQTGAIKEAICGSCEDIAGSLASPALDFYLVERPLAGTEDLSTDNLKQTYANTIATAYGSVAITSANTGTEVITASANHNLSVGQPITFSGSAPAPLVVGTTYYVTSVPTATTFTVSETQGGTAFNITSTGTGTFATAGATFLANTGATALVKIAVAAGATVTQLLADSVTFSYTQDAECVLAAPASIPWVANGTGLSSTRTLRIKQLKRTECDAETREADLALILAGVAGIDIDSITLEEGDGCFDDYTVEQASQDCLTEEECLSNITTFTYEDLPSIEGSSWEVVAEDAGEPNTERKVGIRITANYEDIRFGNDSFSLLDYYETEPLRMEVAVLREWAGACDVSLFPSVVRSKYGSFERQSGEYVVREVIMKTDAYQKHIAQYSESPRMREAFDLNLLNMVDRKAFYNLYYVTYRASYGKLWRKNEQEKFTTIFAFKEDDPTQLTFKSQILDLLTGKSGVSMHVNE